MKDLLKRYENKEPEIVFHWNDPETEAEGWTVINSLRGGAAGGGTRMRVGLDRNEVLSLAKTMEVKFTVSGPAIGGAKSGINFDPSDPRKKGVLERWYAAVSPLLKSYYGTGGDLNVDEIHEVIPITEESGVWHPQEGVFNGHFKPTEADKINRIGQLRQGVIKVLENSAYSPDVSRKYTVADMITGYGVAEAARHFYEIYGGNLEGKRAVIQGFGNVGSAAAYYLAQQGAKIVGVIDAAGGLINEEGFSFEEIKDLF
ncbi:MAG TPA: amino acid dehydrogenase, partial [Leeuwenhoekiella sp.]|nr:amino acid dehydrogenase [Leeuwenhoekiella sp.]